MERKTYMVRKTRQKSKAFSQITLDDDYIVKDNKPDVVKIIHTHGSIVLEEHKVSNQAVWINGKLIFDVLYRSDAKQDKIESLSGTIPFQEKLVMDGVAEMEPVKVFAEVEDLSTAMINSRKLAVRAVVNLTAISEENGEEEICSGLLEGEEYEQKIEDCNLLSLVDNKKDVLRVHSELTLANAKPNIRELVWQNVDLRNVVYTFLDNKMNLSADAVVSILYHSEEDEQIQWVESVIPVTGTVDIENAVDFDVDWVKLIPGSLTVEAKNDYDGELRIVSIDIPLDVDYKLWKEETKPVLKDIYSLKKEVTPKWEPSLLPCFLMKNAAKVRVADTFKVEDNQERILQICASEGKITIDQIHVEETGVRFEGIVTVDILYMTPEDNFPIAHTQADLQFEQLVEISGMGANVWFDYNVALDMLQVNLLDNTEYEVKAAFTITVLAFEENCLEKMTEIEETPLNMETLMEQPGLVGYVVSENEELWDIAKQYHTTVEEIITTNGLKGENIRPGNKLVIVKKVAPC